MALAILVVAREPGTRHLLSAILENAGYQVFTTGNGDAALDIVGQEALDLIVTDEVTPTVDGGDFFRTLAERGQSVPLRHVDVKRGGEGPKRWRHRLPGQNFYGVPIARNDPGRASTCWD